jgi:hypothetical protein
MAKRTAIRELQTRLAARLQSAQEQGTAVSWLALRAAGAGYLFPLVQARSSRFKDFNGYPIADLGSRGS